MAVPIPDLNFTSTPISGLTGSPINVSATTGSFALGKATASTSSVPTPSELLGGNGENGNGILVLVGGIAALMVLATIVGKR